LSIHRRGNNAGFIGRGHVLIADVNGRLVAARLTCLATQLVGYDNLWRAAKKLEALGMRVDPIGFLSV
jgi:hypothetical protein